jgi:hypothetical protein
MAKKMSLGELSAILDGWVTDARSFDRSDLALSREWAIKFYDGDCDIPEQEGRSKVVSHDVADALEWILPALLRIFTSSAKTAIYEPVTQEDEVGAKQATACINYLFQTECDGYRVLHHSMHDSLLHGNGPIKSWFEHAKEYKVETVRGLSEIEYQALLSEPDIADVLEVKEYPEGHPEEGEEITPPDISEEEGETTLGGGGGVY